jgi:hypothetical protein
VWIYSFPQITAQNPLRQQHFHYILNFKDNFVENNLDQELPQAPRRRRASTQKESWKNNTANEWKALRSLRQSLPATGTVCTRSVTRKELQQQHNSHSDLFDSVCPIDSSPLKLKVKGKSKTRVRPKRMHDHLQKKWRICHRCGVSSHPQTC